MSSGELNSEPGQAGTSTHTKCCVINMNTVRVFSLLLCGIGLAGVASGVATADWIRTANVNIGLWEICNYRGCRTLSMDDVKDLGDAHYISVCILIAGLAAGLAALLLHIFIPTAAIATFVSGALCIAGPVYYYVKRSDVLENLHIPEDMDNVSWSFYVAIIGGCLILADSILLIIYTIVSKCSFAICPGYSLPRINMKRKAQPKAHQTEMVMVGQTYDDPEIAYDNIGLDQPDGTEESHEPEKHEMDHPDPDTESEEMNAQLDELTKNLDEVDEGLDDSGHLNIE